MAADHSVPPMWEHVFVSKDAPRGAPDRARLGNSRAMARFSERSPRRWTGRSATVRYWLRRWGIARRDSRLTRVDPATAPREVMRGCRPARARGLPPRHARDLPLCLVCPGTAWPSGVAKSSGSWSRRPAAAALRADTTDCRPLCTSITSTPWRSRLDSRPVASAAVSTGPRGGPKVRTPVWELPRRGRRRRAGSSGSPGWIRTTKN